MFNWFDLLNWFKTNRTNKTNRTKILKVEGHGSRSKD